MISFHKIKFKKRIPFETDELLIERFQKKLKNTYCDNIKLYNENRLVVENEIFRIKPDLNWNLWVGIGSAEINFKDSLDKKYKEIEYIIDFKRYLLKITLYITFVLCISFEFLLDDALFIIVFISVILLDFLIMITRHRLMINKIHQTALTKDNYDWPSILQAKSIEELKMMLSEKAYYPQEILDLVKDELERKYNNYHQHGQ
jgi:hypothetical protein